MNMFISEVHEEAGVEACLTCTVFAVALPEVCDFERFAEVGSALEATKIAESLLVDMEAPEQFVTKMRN